MAFQFPDYPALGAIHQVAGIIVYQWDGQKWRMGGNVPQTLPKQALLSASDIPTEVADALKNGVGG
jgi:fructose-1,6-bisphosphatase/inositol monophosphatase family enzyme